MQNDLAIRSLRETCALQPTALNTEKSYVYWVRQFAALLKVPRPGPLASADTRMETFLTNLALQDMSVSTQNQAFSALLRT